MIFTRPFRTKWLECMTLNRSSLACHLQQPRRLPFNVSCSYLPRLSMDTGRRSAHHKYIQSLAERLSRHATTQLIPNREVLNRETLGMYVPFY